MGKIALVLLVLAGAWADWAEQTDWSGTGGVVGPMDEWGSDYSASQDVDPLSVPGQLHLDGQLAMHEVAAGFDGAFAVHSADIDGDGDIDVLGGAWDLGAVSWWENADGGGTSWQVHPMDESFLGAHSVHGEDLDGDGDIDLLTASFNTEEILWWENLDGAGTQWAEHLLSGSFEDACCVWVEDIDGNGAPDPLGAAYVDDEIAWWNLQAYGGGWLESSVLDTGCGPDWESLQWSGDCPSGTDIGFQVRASNDPDQMGGWSDTLNAPDWETPATCPSATGHTGRRCGTACPWPKAPMQPEAATSNPGPVNAECGPQSLLQWKQVSVRWKQHLSRLTTCRTKAASARAATAEKAVTGISPVIDPNNDSAYPRFG